MNSLEFNLPTISIEELNKIKKEKLEVILDDEDIKEMMNLNNLDINFIKENIYYFSKYKEDKDLCKACKDPSLCKKKGCHLSLSLALDKNNKISFIFSKCPFEKEIDKLKGKYLYRQFYDEIFNYKLSNCLDYFALERAPIIKKMMEFIKTEKELNKSKHKTPVFCCKECQKEWYKENSYITVKCKNCGKFFVPENRSDELYCSNIFENGKNCKEVGPFKIKQKLMETIIQL